MGDLVSIDRRPRDRRGGVARPEPVPARPQPEPLWRAVLGARLREVRHERGLTLVGAADRAGISPQYLSEVERGRKDPSSEVVAAVAGALGTSVLELGALALEDLRSAGAATTTAAPTGPVTRLLAA